MYVVIVFLCVLYMCLCVVSVSVVCVYMCKTNEMGFPDVGVLSLERGF